MQSGLLRKMGDLKIQFSFWNGFSFIIYHFSFIPLLFFYRVTFLGRMCMAFPDYCVNLKCLACGSQEEAKLLLVQKNSKYLQRKSRQPKVLSGY